MEWFDRSVLEAASWRLGSELRRRHPNTTRLIHGRPGGGQSDCLWILPAVGDQGDVRLNRNGTIQVLSRFDGDPDTGWDPVSWDEYLRADPREFLYRLEAAAGLSAPDHVPPATPTTLTYRVLAALTSTAVKSVRPINIEPGYFDTSGYGGGPNNLAFAAFPVIPENVKKPEAGDVFSEPGYRFWFVSRKDEFVLALEQRAGLVWTRDHSKAIDLMALYRESGRDVLLTAVELLRS